LGKTNLDDLAGVGLEDSKLDTVETYAETLGVLLAEVNGVRYSNNNPTKEMRDRAFTHLKQANDAIRKTGQFVFWKDGEKARNYACAYFRDSRSRTKANEEIVKQD